MPSAVLTSHSTLLTGSGWIETSASGTVAAIGVDRHGRLAVCELAVHVSDEAAVEHFLGTRAAFGAFHAESLIVDAAGERRSAERLCRDEDTRSLKYEKCIYSVELVRLETVAEKLWNALSIIALAGNDRTLVIRSLRSDSAERATFARIQRAQLERDCVAFGPIGIERVLVSLLGAEPDAVGVGRRAYRLALWLASSREAIGVGYRLGFDSIQHTSIVRIESAPGPAQVEPLRTAFLAGTANRTVISWADRSWSPISSGFILDGRKL